MAYVDLPLGRSLDGGRDYVPGGFAVGTEPFIALLDIIAVVYAVQARRRHAVSRGGLTSSWRGCTLAYVLTAMVLKPLFGRLSVGEAVQLDSWQAGFVLLEGNQHSIFPSGHTAVVASILSIFWMFWPRYRPLYILAMLGLCLFLGGKLAFRVGCDRWDLSRRQQRTGRPRGLGNSYPAITGNTPN